MNKPELDKIKKYARYGESVGFWKYHQRILYAEGTTFNHPNISIKEYEVLHEFRILLTKDRHCYFVLAIMGIEYVINLEEPGFDSYSKWLHDNNNISILDDIHETKISR